MHGQRTDDPLPQLPNYQHSLDHSPSDGDSTQEVADGEQENAAPSRGHSDRDDTQAVVTKPRTKHRAHKTWDARAAKVSFICGVDSLMKQSSTNGIQHLEPIVNQEPTGSGRITPVRSIHLPNANAKEMAEAIVAAGGIASTESPPTPPKDFRSIEVSRVVRRINCSVWN